MRELALWDGEEGLAEAFSDVEELLGRCRFTDCTHGTEPGCALREAVDSGALSPERLANYLKLQRELAFLRAEDDPVARRVSKRRAKLMGKALKARIADKRPGEG
jgi:ribosome biogenesis GTPase